MDSSTSIEAMSEQAGAPSHRPAPPPPRKKPSGGGQRFDLTTCATLMSCFDFGHRGYVDREDWRKGTYMLQLAEMGEDDELWAMLLRKYGGHIEHGIALDRLADFVPLDPRVNLMMKAMVASVSAVTDRFDRAQERAKNQSASAANKVILMWRKKIMEPVYIAWRDLYRSKKVCATATAAAATTAAATAWCWCWCCYNAVCWWCCCKLLQLLPLMLLLPLWFLPFLWCCWCC